MGQNTSSGIELTHAMKKMRLSSNNSKEDVHSKPIGRLSTPSTPHHKVAGGDQKLLSLAVNAPFETVPSPDESDLPQLLPHAVQNSTIKNDIISGNESPVIETTLQSSPTIINTSSSTTINISDVDELTNEEIIKFLSDHPLAVVNIRQINNAANNSLNRNDGSSLLPYVNEDFRRPSIRLSYVEPSVDDIQYSKRI